MAIREKTRQGTVRRGTSPLSRPGHRRQLNGRGGLPSKTAPFPPVKAASSINSYSKALRFLASLSDFERLRIVRYNTQNFDLDRMRLLLKKLGNPQEKFKSIHVAGTKGKGSTCAMIASMLDASGYKTGLYTSPHLIDIRERIAIAGEMISQSEFARLIRRIEPIVNRMKPTPTYFDVLTAIAFLYFAEQEVQLAVVETGLGGRLDSTNVINPEVTAITSISKDHMAQLGSTLARIAEEKAGIFKKGVPAITVVQDPEADAVLRGWRRRWAPRWMWRARPSNSATGSNQAGCLARTIAFASPRRRASSSILRCR